MNPKVSIIIPVHNAEKFIEETINSCLSQSYPNIEIITIENGSEDNSWGKLQEINDNRLKCYQIPKGNASIARNHGYKKSSGEFIMFLDADDLISENKIESQVKLLKNNDDGYIASCSWFRFIDNTSNIINERQPVWTENKPVTWLVRSWMGEGMMANSCWLVPRQIIDKAGLWNEDIVLNDDGEFFCRILLISKGNLFSEDSIVYYRQIANSKSKRNRNYKAANSLFKVYKSYENEITKYSIEITTKYAIARNYATFIYQFYPNFPDLIEQAKDRISNLEINDIPALGGPIFRIFMKSLGFWNALKLKRLFLSLGI